MELIVTDNIIIVKDFSIQEKNLIVNGFTYKDERSAFSSGGFSSDKIKNMKFYSLYKNDILFTPGLLLDVVKFLKENKLKVSIKDERTKLDYQTKEYTYNELRLNFNPNFTYVEHQIRALRKMLSARRGIIKATTSAGKTEVILAFCKLVNLKTLILVNKQDLGKQTAERLNTGGFPILYRGSDKKGKINKDASYVCTVGLAKELPNDFDIIIVDECHRASSDTFQDYLKTSKAKAFYGFSATPEGNHRVDFMKVKKYLGNIIEEINAQELLEHDVIVYPSITFVENLMPNIPSNTAWASVNDTCLVNNTDRNDLIKKLVEKHNDTTLILIKNIEHGKILERMIDDSFFVSGSEDAETRKKSIEMLNNKEIKVLIASNIFNEGISINSIRVLIIASGGKSRIETVQRLGRALRKDEGKTEAIVYDFYDIGNKYTFRHSKERMKIYEAVGFPVKILES